MAKTKLGYLSAGLAVAGVLAAAPDARACGGLFCANSSPVNQTAERIIFSQNDDGTVTTLVEILYEGPTHEFSWVLPVIGEPEPGLSSTVALDRLQAATNPVYQLQTVFDEGCGFNGGSNGLSFAGGSLDAAAAADGGVVTVVAAGTVGPFDYEIIEVDEAADDPADAAVTWLERTTTTSATWGGSASAPISNRA